MKIIRIHVRKFRIAFDGAIFSRDEIQSGQFRNALVEDFKNMRRQRRRFEHAAAVRRHAVVAMHQIFGDIPEMPAIRAMFQQILHLSHSERTVEIISLDVHASQLTQLAHLFGGLRTLRNDRQSQLVGHVDHGFDDFQTFRRIVSIQVNEFHVEFDGIDVDVLQHVE